MIEDHYFVRPAVAGILGKYYVEARLHTDATKSPFYKRMKELQKTVAGKPANPIYVVLDPETEKELGRVEGSKEGELDELLKLRPSSQ